MSEISHVGDLKPTQAPFFRRLALEIKHTLKEFDEDEGGMNTVEVIILLFVAAVILIAFFTLIWPKIKDAVIGKLEELFSTEG